VIDALKTLWGALIELMAIAHALRVFDSQMMWKIRQ
jgi:hypothetical protein